MGKKGRRVTEEEMVLNGMADMVNEEKEGMMVERARRNREGRKGKSIRWRHERKEGRRKWGRKIGIIERKPRNYKEKKGVSKKRKERRKRERKTITKGVNKGCTRHDR